MASLPYRVEAKRDSPMARRDRDVLSPTVLVAKVLAGALLVFAGVTLVAVAPVTIPILLALAGVIALLAGIGRARYSGPRTREGAPRRWARATVGWGTLALSSVVLLVLALFVPDGYDVLLATLGLAGMVTVRLGMKPLSGPAPVHARVSASDRPTPQRWRRRPSLERYA
jgi:uncharacterized membrane protein HdeD (DUF308 family)